MNNRQDQRPTTPSVGEATSPEVPVYRRSYQKPVLNQVGLLRDLTQFYF